MFPQLAQIFLYSALFHLGEFRSVNRLQATGKHHVFRDPVSVLKKVQDVHKVILLDSLMVNDVPAFALTKQKHGKVVAEWFAEDEVDNTGMLPSDGTEERSGAPTLVSGPSIQERSRFRRSPRKKLRNPKTPRCKGKKCKDDKEGTVTSSTHMSTSE